MKAYNYWHNVYATVDIEIHLLNGQIIQKYIIIRRSHQGSKYLGVGFSKNVSKDHSHFSRSFWKNSNILGPGFLLGLWRRITIDITYTPLWDSRHIFLNDQIIQKDNYLKNKNCLSICILKWIKVDNFKKYRLFRHYLKWLWKT